jgi:hypothetical protein
VLGIAVGSFALAILGGLLVVAIMMISRAASSVFGAALDRFAANGYVSGPFSESDVMPPLGFVAASLPPGGRVARLRRRSRPGISLVCARVGRATRDGVCARVGRATRDGLGAAPFHV